MTTSQHAYEIRPRSDKRGVDLISDILPFGACGTVSRTQSRMQSATAKFYSRSHDVVIGVYDETANVIETDEHAGDFKEW